MNGKNVLITGGAGFVGSHLADLLLQRGDVVQVLDNLDTGSIENIAHLRAHPRFSYFEGSILDRTAMEGLVQEADVIYHLAASVGVQLVLEKPIHAIKTNIEGTLLVLDLVAREGKKILITSTSEVYGKLNKELYSENDDTVLGPTSMARWSYGASKMVDEFLALGYFTQLGLPVVIVRLFNIIGTRQTGAYGMVVPRLIRQALSGEPLTVYGDGSQRRSFTSVGDAVNALATLMEHPQASGQVYNIGHHEDISILELAVMVQELTNSASEIRLVPYEQAYRQGFEDVVQRKPDISKIQRLIGYEPQLGLQDILKQIIIYESQKPFNAVRPSADPEA